MANRRSTHPIGFAAAPAGARWRGDIGDLALPADHGLPVVVASCGPTSGEHLVVAAVRRAVRSSLPFRGPARSTQEPSGATPPGAREARHSG